MSTEIDYKKQNLDKVSFFFPLAALQKTLRHYEIFHKDDVVHRVVKRGAKHSTNPFNTIKEVEFTTLGKNFRLILHPHRDVLHSKFRAYAVDADGNETVVHMGRIYCLYRSIANF